MATRKPRAKKARPKISKTEQAISECYKEILTGKVLAIDPSTGSQSSLPGYAWFEKGELVEMGEIELDISMNRSKRLYEIGRTIREEFEQPDVLIVEYIPVIQYKGAGIRMNRNSVSALIKAVGAIMGAVPAEHMIEIPASSWHARKPDWWEKGDSYDAAAMGIACIEIAEIVREKCKKK